jgi:hypothetical protein
MVNAFQAMAQGLVQQAMGIGGDLIDSVVYSSNSAPTYDPVAGVSTPTSATYGPLSAPIVRFGLDEVDAKVVVKTDAKLLVAYLDLPVTPTENDTVVGKGKNWKVIRTIGTPGNVLWIIHIREV